jgi:hypothetical protein
MDGWRSVSQKTSHDMAIKKIEMPRMVARGVGGAMIGLALVYGIGRSLLVVVERREPPGIGLQKVSVQLELSDLCRKTS